MIDVWAWFPLACVWAWTVVIWAISGWPLWIAVACPTAAVLLTFAVLASR